MKCIFFYFDVLEEHYFLFWGIFFYHFLSFWSSWRGLGARGNLGDLYFQKWAPRFDGSTIFKTCTSKNGKRVTEGAYAFAWDEERAGERTREDETRSLTEEKQVT